MTRRSAARARRPARRMRSRVALPCPRSSSGTQDRHRGRRGRSGCGPASSIAAGRGCVRASPSTAPSSSTLPYGRCARRLGDALPVAEARLPGVAAARVDAVEPHHQRAAYRAGRKGRTSIPPYGFQRTLMALRHMKGRARRPTQPPPHRQRTPACTAAQIASPAAPAACPLRHRRIRAAIRGRGRPPSGRPRGGRCGTAPATPIRPVREPAAATVSG